MSSHQEDPLTVSHTFLAVKSGGGVGYNFWSSLVSSLVSSSHYTIPRPQSHAGAFFRAAIIPHTVCEFLPLPGTLSPVEIQTALARAKDGGEQTLLKEVSLPDVFTLFYAHICRAASCAGHWL
eukprot:2064179-Amphidinium_carterae.1